MDKNKRIYRTFEEHAEPGVYAIIDERDKEVYISHSSNMSMSAARVISQIKTKTHPIKSLYKKRKRLKFMVLDIEINSTARLVKTQARIAEYKALGYTILNKTTNPPNYKLKRFITNDFECWVCLVNSRYKKIKVEQFKTIDEADEFIKNSNVEEIVKNYIESKKATSFL